MKIAMIHTGLKTSTGGERQILRLAIELQKMGHDVEIFTDGVDYRECFPELLKEVTVNVIPTPLQRFRYYFRQYLPARARTHRQQPKKEASSTLTRTSTPTRIVASLFSYYAFINMLNMGRKIPPRFDIINNHNFPTEWAAFIAKKRLKIPVVWMCNEPPFWFFHSEQRKGIAKLNWPLFEIFDKIAVKSIDDIVVLSNIAANIVKGVYSRQSTLIRSGIDIGDFQDVSGKKFRKEYGLESNFILLQVGSLSYYRRAYDSIRALAYLSKKYDNVKLVLVGLGSQEQLKELSTRLGVEDKVLFLGSVSDEELPGIYAACDVFVFPAELTWGLVVIEAMAAGKPVIVSNRTGASEIIENYVNGIVVDHPNLKEIAKHMERLIDNPTLRKKIGENAHKYVKDNLSWEKYARNMEKVFGGAIKIGNYHECK